MLGVKISTKGPIHIHCSVQFNPYATHEKDQPGITFE